MCPPYPRPPPWGQTRGKVWEVALAALRCEFSCLFPVLQAGFDCLLRRLCLSMGTLYLVLGTPYLVLGTLCLVMGTLCLAIGILCLILGTWCLILGTLCLVLGTP